MYKRICCAVLFAALLAVSAAAALSGCADRQEPSVGASAELSVGDRIFFGSYPQSGEEPEPIEWRVLDIKDGRALLISERLLDKREYNEKHENITWEKCSLREWLNSGFIDTAFSPEEAGRIVEVTNKNPNNPVLFTAGGARTADRVFLLSINEAKNYFGGDGDRAAVPTAYASGYSEAEDDCYWWLRSPGGIGNHAAYVRKDGSMNRMGYTIGWKIYIRPALWIEM